MNAIQLPEIESRTLENGLRVLAVKSQKLPLVNLVLMLKSGAEADEGGKAGQADLTLEMLTLGTQKRSSQEIALDIDSLGARLTFHSGWDGSFIGLEGLAEDLAPLVEILSDMVLHPTFPKSEFDQLKARRIARLIQEQDESEVVANIQFLQLAFEGTPYGHPRRGTVDSLKAICPEDLEAFHDRRFLGGQCVLMVVGDIDFEETFGTAAQFLGRLRKGPESPGPVAFSTPKKAKRQVRIIHRPDLTQSQIRMGHPLIERTSPDYDVFQIANYILGGGGFSSRLMEKVRSQKGFTYGISSNFKGRRYSGPFLISTFTPSETTLPVIQEVLEVLEGFIEAGPSSKELEEAIKYHLGSYPFRFETLRKIGREILEVELYGLGLQNLAEYPKRISRVTRTEVHEVARRHLFPEVLSVVIVGNGDAFRGQIEGVGSVEEIDFQTLAVPR